MFDAVAAFLHLGCIYFGATWYRFFGAGERMVKLAQAGSSYPTRITSLITAVLSICALYALTGAGAGPRLPATRWVIAITACVLLLRGIAGIPLLFIGAGRSKQFWIVSSIICIAAGLTHAIGVHQMWATLALP